MIFKRTLNLPFSFNQGRLFYYSPQMLGNNFFILGKNSKFWNKKKGGERNFRGNQKKKEQKILIDK